MAHRILVVEDNRTLGRIAKITLEKAGFEVTIASNGFEGLEMAVGNPPDLIMLDLMLPGIDGFEVCSRLRADKRTEVVPVLITSAKSHDDDFDMAARVRADSYLVKPFSPTDLVTAVNVLLERDAGVATPSVGTPSQQGSSAETPLATAFDAGRQAAAGEHPELAGITPELTGAQGYSHDRKRQA